MNWTALLVFTGMAAWAILLALQCYRIGVEKGRAIGWLERNQEELAREQRRRDALNLRRDRDGMFSEKGVRT